MLGQKIDTYSQQGIKAGIGVIHTAGFTLYLCGGTCKKVWSQAVDPTEEIFVNSC